MGIFGDFLFRSSIGFKNDYSSTWGLGRMPSRNGDKQNI